MLAIILAFAAPVPVSAAPGPANEVYDAPRDIAVYAGAVLVPTDAVDLLRIAIDSEGGAVTSASFRVTDLARNGLEDVLFVHGSHKVHAYGLIAAIGHDGAPTTALAVAAARISPPMDGVSEAFLAMHAVGPREIEVVEVDGVVDESTNTIRVTLRAPIDGTVLITGGLAALSGCESRERCATTPRVMAADLAPDAGMSYVASVSPARSWRDILPEDDGSVSPVVRAMFAALAGAQES